MKGDKEIYLKKMRHDLSEVSKTLSKIDDILTTGERIQLIDFKLYLNFTQSELDRSIAIIEDEE